MALCKIQTSTAIGALLVLNALHCQASISVVDIDYYTQNNGSSAASHTIQATDLNSGSAIDLTGASKLVVTIGGEGSGNAAADNTVTSLTYGGIAMTQIIQQKAGVGRGSSVWYLDLSGVSLSNTDFVLNYTADQDGFGFAAYTLSGTANGFSASAGSGNPGTSNTLDITTLSNNEFIVTTMSRNNFDDDEGSNDGMGGQGIAAPLTEVFYPSLGGVSTAAAYQNAGAAGTYGLTIYDSNNGSTTFVAASFAAIPEPSTAVLCLSGLALALRRRRAPAA